MNESVHVFVGRFEGEEEACAYTQAQFEPEPDESAGDDDYAEWEDREPTWLMKDDLGIDYLDSDFIETITEAERYDYLGKLLVNGEDLKRILAADPAANTLVLIFHEALGGFAAEMKSTAKLTYCGEYAADLSGAQSRPEPVM
jgi:hypothetical protein